MSVNPFNRDSTKVMITAGFVAVFALMLLVAYLSITTLSRVNSSMADLIHNSEQKTSLTYQMRDVIRLRSTEVRAIAQTKDPDDLQKIFDKIFQNFSSTFSIFASILDFYHQRHITELNKNIF